jgi:hypothetical protein
MSTIVYRISVLLGAILADVPVGTNLGVFWLLWALISGWFLLSRGAVFPALADGDSSRTCRDAWRSPGLWALGHRDPRAGVATGGPAGRPVACP